MNKILKKRTLAPKVNEYVVEAPAVAKHAHPGQFIILRVDEEGERNPATVIVGARNKELIMYEDEFRAAAKNLFIATDDGSYGVKGFVTDVLKDLLDKGGIDCVMAVGPMPMMRAVSALTLTYNVKTVVSMNPIMVDGTGMCGGCRITVGGKTRYACVDGPEFDGHEIDWQEAMQRLSAYREQEKEHVCRLTGEKR